MNILAGLELARVPRVPGTQFWTSPLAPADFEVLNTNWHPQSSFYVTSGTLGFKFITQALFRIVLLQMCVKSQELHDLHE